MRVKLQIFFESAIFPHLFPFKSRKQLQNLRAKRRRYRTDHDEEEIQTLPEAIVVIQQSIESLAKEMGSPEFCGMPEVSGTKDLS